MSQFWSPLVNKLEPYVPGEQPQREKLVKLNTNENPYEPSPQVMQAIKASVDSLRLYPDPESRQLRETLARYHQLNVEQVFVGNGSDEVIAHAFSALMRRDGGVCFPDISYSFYPVWCALNELSFQQIPVRENYRIAVEDYPANCGTVIIPNPNAPTGIALSLDDIQCLLKADSNRLVVIDEAYVDFGADSCTSLIASHANLLVVQTLSKSRSLAGLRVGMAYGNEALIDGLNRVKNSFNSYPLGGLAQAAAVAAMEDELWFETCRKKVIGSRERLTDSLTGLGFEVLPSAANFLFAQHPRVAAKELFSRLRQRDVVVRYFDKPRIDNFLRITVGTQDQCDQLVLALAAVLAEA